MSLIDVSQMYQISYIKKNNNLVFMHSVIVNGISCCAMLILRFNHIGKLHLFFPILPAILLFHLFFLYVCNSGSPIFFLGTSMNNLKSTTDLVLWFLEMTSVCTHLWHQNDLIVVHGAVKPYQTKLKLAVVLSICK